MGCDIHGRIEYYVEKQNQWHTTKKLDIDRWYDMFAILAGVRNYVNAVPISEPKGFPKDASFLTTEDYEGWMEDAHSASWLTLREIQTYDWKQVFHDGRNDLEPIIAKDCITTDFAYVFTKMEELADTFGAEYVRIVFWFDN